MSYFASTIDRCDRILDQLELLRRTVAADLNVKSRSPEAGNEIALAQHHVRHVRDRLLSHDHDIARAQK